MKLLGKPYDLMYPPPSASLDKHPWNQRELSWGTLGRSQHARFWGKNQEAKSPIGAIFSCSGHHPKPYRNRSKWPYHYSPHCICMFWKNASIVRQSETSQLSSWLHLTWCYSKQLNDLLLLDITMFLFDYIIFPCEWWMSYRHIWCFKLQPGAANFLCQVPAGPILTPQATRRSPDDHLKPWGTWKMVFTCGWFAGKIQNQIIQLISLWFVLLICFFRIGPMVGWSLYPEITAFRVLNRGVAVRPIINL